MPTGWKKKDDGINSAPQDEHQSWGSLLGLPVTIISFMPQMQGPGLGLSCKTLWSRGRNCLCVMLNLQLVWHSCLLKWWQGKPSKLSKSRASQMRNNLTNWENYIDNSQHFQLQRWYLFGWFFRSDFFFSSTGVRLSLGTVHFTLKSHFGWMRLLEILHLYMQKGYLNLACI